MAAPKPRPTRIKELEGNPGRRPLPKNEPRPQIPDEIPRAPSHLTREAKKEWKSMSLKLHTLGLLTDIDESALALYCQAYGRWVDAEEKLKKTGTVIKTTNGNIVQSPYLGIANTAMRDCHKYLIEFGMTPSSRTKVAVTNKKSESKFSGLIGIKGGKN